MLRIVQVLVVFGTLGLAVGPAAEAPAHEPKGRVLYVRQTVGNDLNDGLSPASAWRSVSRLGTEMVAGDTAYVGPGLYREAVAIQNDGTADARITLIADPAGDHTGDPPGTVMVTGADPVDEEVFEPTATRGVYKAATPDAHVLGVTEMGGNQYRYTRARDTKEHLRDGMTELDVLFKLPSSFHYDQKAGVVYIHTSDGGPPTAHEIELIHRGNGFSMYGRHYVTVIGFAIRHVGDAGITFFTGSSNGIALHNTVYGGRQGVRVYEAKTILVAGNTLFRNDNSGVYFAKNSTDGIAVNNVLYENVKGARWSSESNRGVAIGNVLFDNRERGISFENVTDMRMIGNVLANNAASQFMAARSDYVAHKNCFENGSEEQRLIEIDFFRKYDSLGEYRRKEHQDFSSREGNCPRIPTEVVDVRRLHAESLTYRERALARLAGAEAARPIPKNERRTGRLSKNDK